VKPEQRTSPARPVSAERSIKPLWPWLLASLLLHAVLVVSLPASWWEVQPVESADRTIEWEWVEMDPEEMEEYWQYLRTNPAVPSHEPDETPVISDRDQQAAQPDPAMEEDPFLPEVETGEPDASQVVETERGPEPEPLPPASLPSGGDEGGGGAISPPPAVADTDQELPEDRGEPGGVVREEAEAEEEESDGEADRVVVVGPASERPGTPGLPGEPADQPAQERRPQPRPTVSGDRIAAPPRVSPAGSLRLGEVAVSARFHEFGDYLSRLFEAIAYQWYQLTDAAHRSMSLSRGRVRIEFVLTRDGTVRDLRILEETVPRAAVLICVDAIQSITPFGEWSPVMMDALGEEQTIRVTFLYFSR